MQAGGPGEPRVSNWSYLSNGRWTDLATVSRAEPRGRVQGDDAVVFAADGTAFHSYISFDGIRVERPERAWSGIFVRSTKDGLTWHSPVAVVDHINTAIPFEDKPWLGVDRSGSSPHRGNVYVAWTRFDVYGSEDPAHRSRIMFSRSRDGGRTFSVPLEISDESGDARDSDDTVEGVVPSIGPRRRGLRGVGRTEGPLLRQVYRRRSHVRYGHSHLAPCRAAGTSRSPDSNATTACPSRASISATGRTAERST